MKRVLAGESPRGVTRSLGVCRTSIYRWLRAYRAGGPGALEPSPRTGRPPRLPPDDHRRVRRSIVGRSPRELGIAADLWDREAVRNLVWRRLGVDVGRMGAGRLLRRVGLPGGKPLASAALRAGKSPQPAERARYAAFRRRARGHGARVLFLRLEREDGLRGGLALAYDAQGGFYCEDVRDDRPETTAGFLKRCARISAGPAAFVHDEPDTWDLPVRALGAPSLVYSGP